MTLTTTTRTTGKARGGGGATDTYNEVLARRNMELESLVKSLEREIKILKSTDRQSKRQMRLDYGWDGEEVNLSDKVSGWVKTYLFP